MGKESTKSEQLKKAQAARLLQALEAPDPLTVALRGKVREFIEILVSTELTEALAAVRHARGPSRQGYRHGWIQRTLTTGLGRTAVTLPRGRLARFRVRSCNDTFDIQFVWFIGFDKRNTGKKPRAWFNDCETVGKHQTL